MPNRREFILTSTTFGVSALATPAISASHSSSRFDVDALRDDLEKVLGAFSAPGMAVVACSGEDIVFREGFGFRDVARNEPFTPETVMLVASTTKSYTAGLVGGLVDDGIVSWDTPVREYFPDFQMMDPSATRDMTLTDMMCHRSGLPYHENLLAHGVARELPDDGRDFRRHLLDRLQHFAPSHSFRNHFQYQDIIYTSAGAILEAATGEFFEDLMQERLLDRLGVKATFVRAEATATGRLAKGYGLVDGQIKEIEFCDTRYFAPTAGLYMTADEMIKWIKCHLANGRAGDDQVISEESISWIRRSHMPAEVFRPLVGGALYNYGLGLAQSMFMGHLTFDHGGSFNGARTSIAFVPDTGLGVAVLMNMNLTNGVIATHQVVLAHLLGEPDTDRIIAHFLALDQARTEGEAAAEAAFEAGRNSANQPRLPFDAYEGTYHHPGYGTFVVKRQGDALLQTFDGRSFPLEPYDGETFETKYQSTENHLHHMTMTFESGTDDRVDGVRVPIVPGIAPPKFAKQRDS